MTELERNFRDRMQSDPGTEVEKRTARLFKNAGNRAVRIPVDWKFATEEVTLEYDGRSMLVTPVEKKPTLAEVLDEIAKTPASNDWEPPERTDYPRPFEFQ